MAARNAFVIRPGSRVLRVQTRCFHAAPSRYSSPLFHLAALSASREGQFISKASGIPRVDYTPNSQLLRAEASGSTIPEKASASIARGQEARSIRSPQTSRLITSEERRLSSLPEYASEKKGLVRAEVKKQSTMASQQPQVKIEFPVEGQNSKEEPRLLPRQLVMDPHEKAYLITMARLSKPVVDGRQSNYRIANNEEGALVDVSSDVNILANERATVKDREGFERHLKEKLEKEQVAHLRSEDEVKTLKSLLLEKPTITVGQILRGLSELALISLLLMIFVENQRTPGTVLPNADSINQSSLPTQRPKASNVEQDSGDTAGSKTFDGLAPWLWSTAK